MSYIAKTGLLLNNIRDFGAVGDGVTDCRLAIKAAIDDAIANGKGGIFVPSGVFSVSGSIAPNNLRIIGVDGFLVLGEGKTSILQWIAEDQGSVDYDLLTVIDASNVIIEGVCFDGNSANVTNPGTGNNLLYIFGDSSGPSPVENIRVSHCYVTDAIARGIRLNSHATGLFNRVSIENCDFFDNTLGNAISAQSLEDLMITGCQFSGGGATVPIFISASSSVTREGYIINNCMIDAGVGNTAITVNSTATSLVNKVSILNSSIIGWLNLVQSNEVIVANNQIDSSLSNHAVDIGGGTPSERVVVVNNIIRNTLGNCIDVAGDGDDIIIAGNLCYPGPSDAGILFSGHGCVIANNLVSAKENAANHAISINAAAAAEDPQGIVIIGNVCTGSFASNPIRVTRTAGGPVGTVSIIGNLTESAQAFSIGIDGGSSNFTDPLIISGHRGSEADLIDTADLAFFPEPCFIAGGGGGGVGSAGIGSAGTQYVGTGSPEGSITAYVGDTFQQLDGGAGTTFWIKESGAGTNTGWKNTGNGIAQKTLSGDQGSLSVSTPVAFSVETLTTTAAITTTGNRFVLLANRTYELESFCRVIGSDVAISYQWYNVTAAALVGTEGRSISADDTSTASSPVQPAHHLFRPSVDTTVEVRVISTAGTGTPQIQASTSYAAVRQYSG